MTELMYYHFETLNELIIPDMDNQWLLSSQKESKSASAYAF